MRYVTPGSGYFYSVLYARMADEPHLLIAGATGSGKSVVENGIIHAMLCTQTPNSCQFVLIDPKRVELARYRKLPHVLMYASETGEPARALQATIQIMESRYAEMQKRDLRKFDGGHIYVIVDELADLMLTEKKTVQPLIQRIAQLGRAAKIHLIVCTQSPICQVIPTVIKCCLDSRVGLRTRSSQDSRNILGFSGCEQLPRYGQGYYMTPDGVEKWNLPLITDEAIDKAVKWWCTRGCGVVA